MIRTVVILGNNNNNNNGNNTSSNNSNNAGIIEVIAAAKGNLRFCPPLRDPVWFSLPGLAGKILAPASRVELVRLPRSCGNFHCLLVVAAGNLHICPSHPSISEIRICKRNPNTCQQQNDGEASMTNRVRPLFEFSQPGTTPHYPSVTCF